MLQGEPWTSVNIFTHFTHLTHLCYIGKILETFFGTCWPNSGSATGNPQIDLFCNIGFSLGRQLQPGIFDPLLVHIF